MTMCGSRKYPYLPHGRDWKIQRGGGEGEGQGSRRFLRGGEGCINNIFVFSRPTSLPRSRFLGGALRDSPKNGYRPTGMFNFLVSNKMQTADWV